MIIEQMSKRQMKLIKALSQSKKHRVRHQGFIVEGLKGVDEALKAGFPMDFIVVSEDFVERYGDTVLVSEILRGIEVVQTSDKIFQELSDTVTPQGILALVKMKRYSFGDVLEGNPLLVALDRISDPGNMGTIIRTSDAAGVSAVIVGKGCVDVYNPKVVRATMGSIFHIPILQVEDLPQALLQLKEQGLQVVITHLGGDKLHYDVNFTGPTVIVMGNEDEGVLEDIVRLCDVKTIIEMPGDAESLNVSVAHGIIIFEAVKQRGQRSFSL